ncbi:MCE family protein [bacterium]|nr:MCE family protein [bacterium]
MENYLRTSRRKKIAVGILIVVAILIVGLAILGIGTEEGVFKRRYVLKLSMKEVSGLQDGAPVQLAGLRVGSVTDIAFKDKNGGEQYLEVILKINKKVKDRIRESSIARISTMGLLGDKYVEISLGDKDSRVLEDGEIMKSIPPADITRILTQGTDIIDDAREIAKNLKDISYKINEGTGSLGMFLNDPWLYFDIDEILGIMRSLAVQMEKGESTIGALMTDRTLYDDLTTSLKDFSRFIDTLQNSQGIEMIKDTTFFNNITLTASRLNDILARFESKQGTAGLLLNDRELHDELVKTLSDFEALINDVNKNPKKYIRFSIFDF